MFAIIMQNNTLRVYKTAQKNYSIIFTLNDQTIVLIKPILKHKIELPVYTKFPCVLTGNISGRGIIKSNAKKYSKN